MLVVTLRIFGFLNRSGVSKHISWFWGLILLCEVYELAWHC